MIHPTGFFPAARRASLTATIMAATMGVDADVPPLTNSVQENFRGFTYHGESLVMPPAGVLAQMEREQQERELQALREAKFRQFEEWQRQQLTDDKKGNNDAARRVV